MSLPIRIFITLLSASGRDWQHRLVTRGPPPFPSCPCTWWVVWLIPAKGQWMRMTCDRCRQRCLLDMLCSPSASQLRPEDGRVSRWTQPSPQRGPLEDSRSEKGCWKGLHDSMVSEKQLWPWKPLSILWLFVSRSVIQQIHIDRDGYDDELHITMNRTYLELAHREPVATCGEQTSLAYHWIYPKHRKFWEELGRGKWEPSMYTLGMGTPVRWNPAWRSGKSPQVSKILAKIWRTRALEGGLSGEGCSRCSGWAGGRSVGYLNTQLV